MDVDPEDLLASRKALFREAKAKPVQLSVRTLLSYWGAKRRGYWVVDRIRRDLEAEKLGTEPDLAGGWIDNVVTLAPLTFDETAAGPLETTTAEPTREVSLKVGALESANGGVLSVQREDSLQRAESLMMAHDYSQLAVLAGTREVAGAVNWESIAQARFRPGETMLTQALVQAEVVSYDDDLIPLIGRIADAGYVFVRRPDRTLSGIVTPADLSLQFAELAGPFLLLGEVERRLRRVIDQVFTPEELQSVKNLDEERPISTADDLTMGQIGRLLERRESWERMGWPIDRAVFVGELHKVREIRNDVMHFSPDPIDDGQINQLRHFVKWLRTMDP